MKNFEGTIVLGADNLEKMMLLINKARNDDEHLPDVHLKPQHSTSGRETTCPRLACAGCKGGMEQSCNKPLTLIQYT